METIQQKIGKAAIRDNTVNIYLVHHLHMIYLSAYTRRNALSPKSTSHITECVKQQRMRLKLSLTGIELNEQESKVISELQRLLTAVIQTKQYSDIPEVMYSASSINQLLHRNNIGQVFDGYADFVLAITGQVHYQGEDIKLPMFSIGNPNQDSGRPAYFSTLRRTRYGFKSDQLSKEIGNLWSNVFRGVVLPSTGDTTQHTAQLLFCTNIDTLPDMQSGIGINRVTLDNIIKYRSSSIMSSCYPPQVSDRVLLEYLAVNNRRVPSASTLIALFEPKPYTNSAMEAEEDDLGDGEDVDDGDTTLSDEPDADADTGSADDDDVDNDDTSMDDSDSGEGDSSDEEGDDESETGETPEENNIKEAKKLLNLKLELSKDEDFDDILYKLSVVRHIDELKKSSDIPINTITALIRWKNQFIFLVSANETRKFLRNLKYNMK